MLSTMRQSWLLCALFALTAFSSAMGIEEVLNIDGIEAYLHHGYKRQATGTGNSGPSSTPPPSSSAAPTSTPNDSSTPPPTSAPPDTTSTDDQPSSTPGPSSQESSAEPSSTPEQSSQPPSRTTKTPVVSTSFQVATSLEPYTTVVLQTLSDGRTQAITSTGSRTAIVTTGSVQFTDPASLKNSGGSGGGGLSSSNRKVIGGVVGGVGGAILLGGIAIVCWRIWGRKRRVSEEDDDLMAGTGTALGDKTHTSPAGSPFQNNLEQYHNPGGRPNAAANF